VPVALQVVLGVVIAVLIALLIFRRRPARTTPPRPEARPSGDLTERLRTLVAQGRRIQAIKELRERTRMSLLDARNYVEHLPPTGPVPPPVPPPAELSPRTAARARVQLAAGRYVYAVKVVREDTGWSLTQAKDAVDRLRDG
jgi:ribosomal protein L7/L12